jgi:hypothetical protein
MQLADRVPSCKVADFNFPELAGKGTITHVQLHDAISALSKLYSKDYDTPFAASLPRALKAALTRSKEETMHNILS